MKSTTATKLDQNEFSFPDDDLTRLVLRDLSGDSAKHCNDMVITEKLLFYYLIPHICTTTTTPGMSAPWVQMWKVFTLSVGRQSFFCFILFQQLKISYKSTEGDDTQRYLAEENCCCYIKANWKWDTALLYHLVPVLVSNPKRPRSGPCLNILSSWFVWSWRQR